MAQDSAVIPAIAIRFLPHALATLAALGALWWAHDSVWDKGYARCENKHVAQAAEAAAAARKDYLDAIARGDEISAKLATAQAENRRLRNDLANDVDRLRGLCPAGLRILHDAAAAGHALPEAARASLDSPATVDARAVAQAIAGNYADCRGYIDQLNALIDWHTQ